MCQDNIKGMKKSDFNKAIKFTPIYLSENRGLGNALREALNNCKNDLVARMDSDDISAPYRFEMQLEKFNKDPKLDIVGGFITEFVGHPSNIIGERRVELTDEAIRYDMKKRCAFNHVTVMYKKSSVQEAGGYQDWYFNEDYWLWIRMLEKDFRFANVPYPLVNVRAGEDMSARRGGLKYFRSEYLLQKYMFEHKMISFSRYLYNILLRFGGEVLASNYVRQKIYKFIRNRNNSESSLVEIKDNDIDIYPQFSVAMSVYKNDNPEWFDKALESIIINQTIRPDEVVLVIDGPVPVGIQQVIDKYVIICLGDK